MTGAPLDPRLAADSLPLGGLSACQVRLMNERRWPWLILVPQGPELVELHDMGPGLFMAAMSDLAHASRALKAATGCLKVNTGALGNVVRQLHLHVVARNEGDANWPGPVWGHGVRQPYEAGELSVLADRISSCLFQPEGPA